MGGFLVGFEAALRLGVCGFIAFNFYPHREASTA
jgi:hypothetical protein